MSLKNVFLFPGQGAQYVGMGKQVVDDVPAAAELFSQANEVLGYDLAEICFSGPAEKLNSTVHSQPGLFVCSMAALERMKQETPELLETADAAAGLSLGEYTALVFAGAMSFADALRVVQCRGEAMQAAADASPSGMVSVLGLDETVVQRLCDESRQPDQVLQIANYLCPGNLVCSGHQASCKELSTRAEEAGAMKVIPLAVAGAFHTPLMESALERLRDALASTTIERPRLPVISNVDTQAHWDAEELRETLVKQVISPVRWEASMRALIDDGAEAFYEIGPGKVLRGLLKRIDRKKSCPNIE